MRLDRTVDAGWVCSKRRLSVFVVTQNYTSSKNPIPKICAEHIQYVPCLKATRPESETSQYLLAALYICAEDDRKLCRADRPRPVKFYLQMKFYSPLTADFFPNEPDYEDEFYDEYTKEDSVCATVRELEAVARWTVMTCCSMPMLLMRRRITRWIR